MNQIRKISLGEGHPDKMMHYQVGKRYLLSSKEYELTDIVVDRELFEKGKLAYNIFIANDVEKVLWKTIIGVPAVVEYNIDFK